MWIKEIHWVRFLLSRMAAGFIVFIKSTTKNNPRSHLSCIIRKCYVVWCCLTWCLFFGCLFSLAILVYFFFLCSFLLFISETKFSWSSYLKHYFTKKRCTKLILLPVVWILNSIYQSWNCLWVVFFFSPFQQYRRNSSKKIHFPGMFNLLLYV